MLSWFPAAFRPPAFASWSSFPAREFGSPHGRLTGQGRTQTGFPRSARTRHDRDGCPLYPGDDGARPDRPRSPTRVCRISSATSLHPATTTHHARLCFTRHQRGFKRFTRPVFPSPDTPGWNESVFGFPPSSAPRPRERRTSGQGQATRHGPETTLYVIDPASNLACLLNACDLASHS